ncbi:ABC transporter ATP-binding protein [Rubellimicrobium arenae]|uniref:ABC transporter ATP-binding protein n=1 Tax=Rubellimicrobium arenae TaxID=2817372 RepID=UPI001B312B4E|nr:ABC transporter ATP-binding protein [Rubellimicrobium arenae]
MIDVENLNVFYGRGAQRFHAVRGVSFRVARGETYGLVGESGSGKSSVLNAIAGRHTDWTGSVRLDGTSVDPMRRTTVDRRKIQIVFQDPYGAIHPRHTVGSTIAEPLEIHGLPDPGATVERLLAQVCLPPRFRWRYPHQISGGQRQRVSIARALALDSPILLLDEPTSALDVSVQAEVLNLLQDLRSERGLTYLMVTHDMGVVGHMCDRIGVMRDGQIIEELTREALIAGRVAHPYTKELRETALLVG